jgi:hypothetical protein
MKNLIASLGASVVLAVTGQARTVPVTADVVVYGGTSAGVVAAVQAAKMNQQVALIEPGQHLGGMSVEGLGGSDIDNHPFRNSPAVGGLTLQFYRKTARRYGKLKEFDEMLRTGAKKPALWRFESHVAEEVFDTWLKEHPGIRVFRGTRLPDGGGVVKDGPRITGLKAHDGREFRGKVFIDATYEGDLLAAAGVTTAVGRESNATYGETLNGIRTDTNFNQFRVRVDPYKVPGDPSSGLIVGVQDSPLGQHGEGDDSIQAYCFRLCLTKDPDNRIPFAKPETFDDADYEIYRRFVKAGGKLWKPGPGIPNGKTDLGSWHDLSGNLIGWNHEWPTAGHEERQRLLHRSLTFIQGLCWFLANDPSMPEDVRQAWSQWGVCRDEFQDHGGWPRMFYVRNGRRMVSDFVLTEAHGRKEGQVPVEDPVALVWWPFDLHNARRLIKDGAVWNEGAVFGGDQWAPFGVAYRSLVPKASECTNLLTPTCPSSSYVAYGAFRLEWTFMATAQSAATAAVLALQDGVPVQEVSYEKLKARLLKDAQVLQVPVVTKDPLPGN